MNNRWKEKDYPRKKDALSMGEALAGWIQALHIQQPYQESYIIQHWEKIMGSPIAKRTDKLFIKKKKLYVYLNSAPLKQELNASKGKVLELLNKAAGDTVLEDVEFY
ncbi:MAG: DUF721 domain-containing protein [Cytophagaceae bacterium]|jgi:hypothetical protein|nr:DUF721 domain-containing protein [Cytophagaceae bacterium]